MGRVTVKTLLMREVHVEKHTGVQSPVTQHRDMEAC